MEMYTYPVINPYQVEENTAEATNVCRIHNEENKELFTKELFRFSF